MNNQGVSISQIWGVEPLRPTVTQQWSGSRLLYLAKEL
ncbi:hypothetical protein PORCRE_603 [Porphyromonas crevioricanis JCM 15906]|uniref:Uncharacterized protein n=1 Tax=Porphyromonas crevioricanis JCM 15906 TaxID=1305617 RepID=T1CGQ1_9PORP|nr:hypothetical protein PORCRE_603 [Porphyromonas crevioricanis JCM 15906]GAD06843.1 hypothetical protein PORCAN_451 [Porphyromonas crevioricanis JCM 13913]